MDLTPYAPLLGRLHWHLSSIGISKTKSRDILYILLYEYGPCSKQELLTIAQGLIGQASVYNNLAMFLSTGISQEAGSERYELTDRFKQHHHYLWCRVCGGKTGFNDHQLERTLERLAKTRNFGLEDDRVELAGICPKCLLDSNHKPREPIGKMLRRRPGLGVKK